MKHIPILFSTEMVQAILDGRKKMTRRILPIQPLDDDKWILATLVGGDNKNIGKRHWVTMKDSYTIKRYDDRYFDQKYSIGDILWVRESFHEPIQKVLFGNYWYKADLSPQGWDFKWKPSIHMPKEACRIFLRVTDVRIERLQDITEQDAIDEGIKRETFPPTGEQCYYFYPCADLRDDSYLDSPKTSFYSLWASINGQSSWDANPYVWVISFERCERPADFITRSQDHKITKSQNNV